MKKTILFIVSIASFLLLLSCSSKYKNVSQKEFMEAVLPNTTVHSISVINNNAIIETTTAAKAYRIKEVPAKDLEVLLNKIQSENDQVGVTFSQGSNSMPSVFF
ncbi:MAG: hypothetical protein R3299_04870 [Arenibacter sp.]|nr:hypothetical protein [Arenibacter sp.]